MNAPHTPGPWRVDPSFAADVQNDSGTLEIASTHPMVLSGGEAPDYNECYANARLIAAAPELLSQLQFAVKLLSAFPAMSGTAQVQSMRETIAKARGEVA